MDTEKYRALITAIETGSFSEAARKLKYTPSGISRMIAALEEEHGWMLLHRNRDGVLPTKACEALLPAIREFLYRGEILRQKSQDISGLKEGTIVIGTAYDVWYGWIAEMASEFQKLYPDIRFQICNGYSSELLEKLEQYQIDMCIISRREGDHEWLPLMEDEMVAWIPPMHRLASASAIPVRVFETEAYIETLPGRDVDNARLFRKYHLAPNTRLSTMDSFATYAMVEAGLGISMNNGLNGRGWKGKVKILPLDPSEKVEIGLACLKESSPAVRAFLKFIQSCPDKCP